MLLANERALSKSTGAVTGGGPYPGLVWDAVREQLQLMGRMLDVLTRQSAGKFWRKSERYRPGISHRSLPRGRTRGGL